MKLYVKIVDERQETIFQRTIDEEVSMNDTLELVKMKLKQFEKNGEYQGHDLRIITVNENDITDYVNGLMEK